MFGHRSPSLRSYTFLRYDPRSAALTPLASCVKCEQSARSFSRATGPASRKTSAQKIQGTNQHNHHVTQGSERRQCSVELTNKYRLIQLAVLLVVVDVKFICNQSSARLATRRRVCCMDRGQHLPFGNATPCAAMRRRPSELVWRGASGQWCTRRAGAAWFKVCGRHHPATRRSRGAEG